MKQYLIRIFLLNLICVVYSENFTTKGQIQDLNNLYYDINLTSDIKFSEGTVIIKDYDNGEKENSYIISSKKVKLCNDSSIPFIQFDDAERYLILANQDILLVYDENNITPKFLATNFGGQSEFIEYINPVTVKASSELKEGSKIYAGENIANLNITEPWVENAKDNGINEEISFLGNCTVLYILNGYVSFDKPYLYEANSRLKKIEVSFPDELNKTSIIVELNDTPNPQKIDLGFRCQSQIKIKILDVYEGKKYKDTCLSGIIMRVY